VDIVVNGLVFASALLSLSFFGISSVHGARVFEKDVINTPAGNLEITFIGHGSLMMSFAGHIIHVDPFSQAGDYSGLPAADLVLITHDHMDHLDLKALKAIRTDKTQIVLTAKCAEKVKEGKVMKNGDSLTVLDIDISAVPAYNMVHKAPNGQPFHPKGEGNGYVLTLGGVRVYIAGDTENIPEMDNLKNIDIAFLPMNLPYTMTPEMVADSTKMFSPKVLYPYHYGDTNTSRIIELLKPNKNVEVRIRKLK
jgi:L-ascorbate metabolism protein UlaG (beta-lactamase superfamily)